MASFTDKSLQFNPYIPQTPVQAMVEVGRAKQAQYDQGVQRIQGYIDSIAGMDVVNDADKAYLQSKINELGSKLKTVAAGDFSNQQLVNSVGGMATQIVKDPIVQNAVSSTNWYRRQLEEMEKAIAEGKSSQANILDFQNKANQWLSSEKAGTPFRGRYTPYRDLNKVAMDTIKTLHPKLQKVDIPYVIKNGKIQTGVIADALRREKITEIDEGQIETAIAAAMTPDDYNQLSIDANYALSGVTPDALINRVNTDLDANTKFAQAQVNFIKSQLPKYATDPVREDQLKKRLAMYEEQLGKDGKPGTLATNAAADIDRIKSGDVSSAKYSIYKDGFFKQFANAFAWQEDEVTYEDSPLMQVQLKKDQLATDRMRENRLAQEFKIKTKLDERKIQLDEEANYLKKVELGLINPNTPTPLGSPTDNKLQAGTRLDGQIDKTLQNIDSDVNMLKAKGLSDAQVSQMVTDYAKNGNKSDINPAYIPTIQSILKQQKNLKALTDLKDNTLKEATNLVMNDATVQAQLASKPFSTEKISFKDTEGRTINVTEKDLFELYKRGDVSFSTPRGLKGGSMSINWNGQTYNIESARFGVGRQLSANEFTNKLNEYNSKFKSIYSDIPNKINDKYLEMLAPRVAELVPTGKFVNYGKEQKLPINIAGNLSVLISAANEKDIAADDKYDRRVAASYLTKDNLANTMVWVQANPDGTYFINMQNNADPDNIQRLKVDAATVASNLGSQYLTQNAEEALLLKLGRGTTNVNNDPKQAEFQSQFGDFPNMNRYQVLADLDEDPKSPGTFVPKFYAMKKDGTYQTFVIAGRNKAQRLGLDQAKQQFNTLSDEDFIKLIKTQYPTYNFSNLYQK